MRFKTALTIGQLLSFLILICACSESNYYHQWNGKFKPKKEAQYFYDFDLFKRKGVGLLDFDSLDYPFFEVINLNDSTIRFTRITEGYKTIYDLPTDGRIFHRHFDIKDGTTNHYFRILKDRIVKFAYYGDIYSAHKWYGDDSDSIFLFELIPAEVEIQIGDTLYRMISPDDCWGIETFYEDVEIKIAKSDIEDHWVLPFSLESDIDCEHVEKWYYNTQGQLMRTQSDGTMQIWNNQPIERLAYWRHLIFRY